MKEVHPGVFEDDKKRVFTKHNNNLRIWDAYHSALSFKKRKGKIAKEKKV